MLTYADVCLVRQHKLAERGDALVTTMQSCQLVRGQGAGGDGCGESGGWGRSAGRKGEQERSNVNLLAVGDSKGVLHVLNVDAVYQEAANATTSVSQGTPSGKVPCICFYTRLEEERHDTK
jgi:hypothetical protein